MAELKNTIAVRVNVEMTTESLQAIVANAKKIAGQDERGFCNVDTADKVSEIVSLFLLENDFETFAKDIKNYSVE